MHFRHHDRDGNPVAESDAPFTPGPVTNPDPADDPIPEEGEDREEVEFDDVDDHEAE